MADDDVHRVARGDASPSVEQIAGALRAFGEGDTYRPPTQQAKAIPSVEQGIVDAPRIITTGDAVAVTLASERCTAQEVCQDGVVLHLAQPDERRCLPPARSQDDACRLLQVIAVSSGRPVPITVGQELVVVRVRIVVRVEEVFHVVTHHLKRLCSLRPRRAGTRG